MREEFPSLARIRRPTYTIGRESLAWAFASGIGAGAVVGGIVRVALLWLGPLLLPATQPHPDWLSASGLSILATAIATGAVLMRAGGAAAIGVYVAYELARLLVALPGRLAFCANSRQPLPPPFVGCDYVALVIEHWTTWLGVVVGIAVAVLFVRASSGQNRLLRAAGAFSLVLVVVTTPVAILIPSPTVSQSNIYLAVFTAANVLAGCVAGILLAGHRLAAAVLLAVLIVAPGMAFALPSALRGAPAGADPSLAIARWSGVFVPLAAAAALFLARTFVRMGAREAGTDS